MAHHQVQEIRMAAAAVASGNSLLEDMLVGIPMINNTHYQEEVRNSDKNSNSERTGTGNTNKPPPPAEQSSLKCPRCESTNTKFCYYNNYSLSQPRYFCKSCRRYWTKGGSLRNVPVGGGCRKNNKRSSSSFSSSSSTSTFTTKRQNPHIDPRLFSAIGSSEFNIGIPLINGFPMDMDSFSFMGSLGGLQDNSFQNLYQGMGMNGSVASDESRVLSGLPWNGTSASGELNHHYVATNWQGIINSSLN
ncbi:hypothetical protein SAY87_025425 [Trapa incisa]|uniref:Dof zinc finger protein n=1 Tax=Trapa incisa TaxID=236973 RepID=A0AAN7GSL0_9MYRT|nr:hypothetical protein SAY87_025425 [Trapa incisa]